VLALGGCSFWNKPALPRHASIEHVGTPAAATDYRALIEEADVIYFPEERAASGAKSEPAALIVEAAEQSAKPFATAWDLIDITQQPFLDQLPPERATRDEALRKVELSGTGRAREHCRAVLRQPNIRGVALRLPQMLQEKLASGANLTGEEQALLPAGYNPPGGGYEAYAENLANRGQSERNLSLAYKAEVLRREAAAEAIVRYFRSAGSEAKVIVFARAADFADDKGIPFYVAQKLNVRQLVLGREGARSSRTQLLALAGDGSFEVVDRSPWPARDKRTFVLPWAGAGGMVSFLFAPPEEISGM